MTLPVERKELEEFEARTISRIDNLADVVAGILSEKAEQDRARALSVQLEWLQAEVARLHGFRGAMWGLVGAIVGLVWVLLAVLERIPKTR